MDRYLDDANVIERLVSEWTRYGRLVVAYDYDNTVYDYHQAGLVFRDVPQLLRECRAMGAYLIVFTACGEDQYPAIRSYLEEQDIPFDAINENPPFVPVASGRKIYCNILLDDRAGLGSAYRCLKSALEMMKRGA